MGVPPRGVRGLLGAGDPARLLPEPVFVGVLDRLGVTDGVRDARRDMVEGMNGRGLDERSWAR